MKVIITNLGAVAVPLSTDQAGGLAAQIDAGGSYALDSDEFSVVTVGDNPSFREDVREALENVAAVLKKLVTFWREHPEQQKGKGKAAAAVVHLHVENVHTDHGLRMRLGDTNQEQEVLPGSSAEVEAPDYIELRELGISNAAVQPEAP